MCTLFMKYFASSCNCVMNTTSHLYSLQRLMVLSMSTCAYGSLVYRMTVMMSRVSSNSLSTYYFTLSWKVLNWSFVLRFSATVPSMAPNDGTLPVKFSKAILPCWFFFLFPFWFILILFLSVPSMDVEIVAALVFDYPPGGILSMVDIVYSIDNPSQIFFFLSF